MRVLNDRKFVEFKVGELFEPINGDTDIKKIHINGFGLPVVSSGVDNRGVIGFSDIVSKNIQSGSLTIDMFGNCFYRDFNYKIVTHARVFSLVPKSFIFDSLIGLYFESLFGWCVNLFSYDNMCSYNKIKDSNLLLPVIPHPDSSHVYSVDDVDWQYMQDTIKELEQDTIKELDTYLKVTGLDDYELTDEDKKVLSLSRGEGCNQDGSLEDDKSDGIVRYGEFRVGDLFDVLQTKSVVAKSNLVDGEIPYVTRTVSNNGYTQFCGNVDKINEGNCITIGAETGVAFYQPNDFVAGNKVYRLVRNGLNQHHYFYISSLLNKQTINYSYSNARIPEKIKNETISLPITPSGDIDFDYMESYIKAIQKLVIVDVVKYKDSLIEATKKVVSSSF